MTAKGSQNKILYEYDNYREFLRDYYLAAKAKDAKFSFRYFARLAGLSSPSSLKRVIDNQRNLTQSGIEKFIRALKLNKEEAEFFTKLVMFNQAKISTTRHELARDLMRTRGYRKTKPFSQAQFNCFSKWYVLPIREMVNLPNFKEEPAWIAKRLHPPIKPEEARTALQDLSELGLLERNSEGRLIQTNAHVSTGDEVVSSTAAQYHRDILNLASQAIDTVNREKRDISTMTVGVSPKAMKRLKEMIQEFRKEVVEVLSQESATVEGIYQLNFQLIPVVNFDDEKGSK